MKIIAQCLLIIEASVMEELARILVIQYWTSKFLRPLKLKLIFEPQSMAVDGRTPFYIKNPARRRQATKYIRSEIKLMLNWLKTASKIAMTKAWGAWDAASVIFYLHADMNNFWGVFQFQFPYNRFDNVAAKVTKLVQGAVVKYFSLEVH